MTSEQIKIAIDMVPDLDFDYMFEETRLDIVKNILDIKDKMVDK